MNRVYMDANATTPLAPEVFAAMRPWFTEQFGNASSIHFYGQRARAAVERAREQVARLLGCRPAEVVFTSGGTEADNLALTGVLKPGDHLITSSIEHHAVLLTAERLRERGIDVTFLPVDASGVIDPEDVRRAVRDEMARTVEDVLARRTRSLILNARAAMEMAERVAELMATELGRDAAWAPEQVVSFRETAALYVPQ